MGNKILDNKGVVSIKYISLILTAAIIASGFINITARTMSLNEVQGQMDKAGIIALRSGVDETQWRRENLVVNEQVAKNKFREIVESKASPSRGRMLKNLNVREVNIYPPNHPNLGRLGIASDRSRQQYFIESIVEADYSGREISDKIAILAIEYFDFFHTNHLVKKEIETIKSDGNSKILIRSVSRIVLR